MTDVPAVKNTLLPTVTSKKAFTLISMEILQDMNKDLRMDPLAVKALQKAGEMFITHFFEDSYLVTKLLSRNMLTCEDMKQCAAYRKTLRD